MKRRNFIANSFLAAGGVLIGSNILHAQAFKEINRQFTDDANHEGYDLIIHGAGLAGYYAAIEAAHKGWKVLILDKRTSPGYDIAAKNKLWIQSAGYKELTREQIELFFPAAESGEMFNHIPSAISSPDNSLFDNELLLFSGSVKKGLLRNLFLNKVHVMLMTDVCGIVTDDNNVHGVLVACKQGLFSIKCKSFLDATENVLFTRELFNQSYKIKKAGFVIELINVSDTRLKEIKVDETFGILNHSIFLHKGKKAKDQQFLGFEFIPDGNDLSTIEQKARSIAAKLSKNFSSIAPTFNGAKLNNWALECSYFLESNTLPKPSLNGYYCCDNPTSENLSCGSLFNLIAASKDLVGKIRQTTANKNKKIIRLIGVTTPQHFKNNEQNLSENGVILPFSPFIPDKNLDIQEEKCQVLVAGGGTAGGNSGHRRSRKKGHIHLFAEYFNDLGGTKTMGGVSGYYHGLMDHPFIKQLEKNVTDTRRENNLSGGIERRFHLLKTITELGCKLLTGVIFCGAITKTKNWSV